MQFSFTGRHLPMTLRVCRSLIWTQAAFVFLAGAFVIFEAVVLGTSTAIPFHGDTLAGGRAAALGAVYVAVASVLVYLGVELGRLSGWARNAIVFTEVFLAILLLFRSFDLSVSTFINVGLCLAAVVLLFLPESRRAFDGTGSTPA